MNFNWEIIILILVTVFFLIGLGSLIVMAGEMFEERQELSCSNYFLQEIKTLDIFRDVCETKECKDRFEKEIILNLEYAEGCFK